MPCLSYPRFLANLPYVPIQSRTPRASIQTLPLYATVNLGAPRFGMNRPVQATLALREILLAFEMNDSLYQGDERQ